MSARALFLQGARYTGGMAHGGGDEIEIKLRVTDPAAARKRLAALGARGGSRVHEANVLLDSAAGTLRSRGTLLRLRAEWPAGHAALGKKHGGERRSWLESGMFPPKGRQPVIVTWKGPASTAPTGRAGAAYKVRREVEFVVADSRAIREILAALDLHPCFFYEKIRATYRMPRVPGLVITLDETPAGVFIELEGRPAAIDRVRRALGYQAADAILLSYGALHAEHCESRGVPPGDMLFE